MAIISAYYKINLMYIYKVDRKRIISKIKQIIGTITFFTCCCYMLFAGTTEAQTIIVKACHVFDARTGRMLEQQFILIRNGKVQQMEDTILYTSAGQVIDLSDSWVLPGQIDCHVHLTVGFPYKKMAIEHMYRTNNYRY